MVRVDLDQIKKEEIYKILYSLKKSAFEDYCLDKMETYFSDKESNTLMLRSRKPISTFEPFVWTSTNRGVIVHVEQQLGRVYDVNFADKVTRI